MTIRTLGPRVHFATYRDEDTGQTTPYFLYSHDEIDAEIDRRIRGEGERAAQHEATRLKFHAALAADSARAEARCAYNNTRESAAI